jgi:hypothetical protein
MHPAALSRSTEHPAGCGFEANMRIRDDELDTTQAPPG